MFANGIERSRIKGDNFKGLFDVYNFKQKNNFKNGLMGDIMVCWNRRLVRFD